MFRKFNLIHLFDNIFDNKCEKLVDTRNVLKQYLRGQGAEPTVAVAQGGGKAGGEA